MATDNLDMEELATQDETDGLAELKRDVERLLSRAESFQEKSDQSRLRIGRIWWRTVLVTVGILFLLGLSWENNDPVRIFTVSAIFPLTAIIVLLGYLFAESYKDARRDFVRDRDATLEIVDLLRELERSMNRKKVFSNLERAEFRIRLSCFGIGSGKPSNP